MEIGLWVSVVRCRSIQGVYIKRQVFVKIVLDFAFLVQFLAFCGLPLDYLGLNLSLVFSVHPSRFHTVPSNEIRNIDIIVKLRFLLVLLLISNSKRRTGYLQIIIIIKHALHPVIPLLRIKVPL